MKPNTSNNFNDDGEEMLYNDGFKQGYAKALDDVKKIINTEIKINNATGKMLHTCQGRQEDEEGNRCLVCFENNVLGIVRQEIAKLAKLKERK